MKQRLFYMTDLSREAPMEKVINNTTRMQSCSNFLTAADRELIAKVYEYAQDEGADLMYVNCLAFGLARYRQDNNGKITGPHNGLPEQGKPASTTFHFTEKDAATAKRIREGDAFKTTELDRGFILRITDENYSAIFHTDFNFLERVINKFSAKGETAQPLGPAYAKHEYIKENYIKRTSKTSGSAPTADEKSVNPDKRSDQTNRRTPPNPDTDLRQLLRAILRRLAARIPSLFELMFKSRR